MSSIPILTFCIPTYNRLERVQQLVLSLLSLPDDDIEVVVLDNASTDGTAAALSQIRDARFKLAVNPENRGALFNMVNVFDLATGTYVVYSTDQDKTNIDRIADFKASLRQHPEVSCGFCNFDVKPGTPRQQFPRGISAVRAIAYKGRHPTGYFFRNEDLREVKLAKRFADFNVVDLFPLEFAFAEIAMMGDGLIYSDGLFIPNNSDDVVQHKSSTTNGAARTAFFAPAARLKLALSYSQHVEQLALSPRDKSRLASQIFLAELGAATIGYKTVMSNQRLCIHYRMVPRKIGRVELVRTGLSFVIGYFSPQLLRPKVAPGAVFFGAMQHIASKIVNRLVRT